MLTKETPFEHTDEQIAAFAQGNVRGLALAAIAFCRDHEVACKDFWCYTGRLFAPEWNWVKSTDDVLYTIIGNLRSMGFELLDISGDEYEYTVTVTGWPSDEELDYFDLTRADTDELWRIFVPITDFVAHDFSWQRDGDAVIFTVTRR
jgi:hypothetical protein